MINKRQTKMLYTGKREYAKAPTGGAEIEKICYTKDEE